MATKVCYKCNTEKDISEFNQNNSKTDGLSTECSECNAEYLKQYYKINRERLLNSMKEHAATPQAKAARKKYATQYRLKNKKLIQKENKKYQQNNKKVIRKNKKRYHSLPEIKLRENKRKRDRMVSDPMFKLNCNMGSRINQALKGAKNGRHWEDLIGYSLSQLKKHLEKQFVDGMSWKNYGRGGWVIDHKVPKVAFNFTQPEHRDFRRCWGLKNLQPMWEHDNMVKNRKLEHHFQPSLLI